MEWLSCGYRKLVQNWMSEIIMIFSKLQIYYHNVSECPVTVKMNQKIIFNLPKNIRSNPQKNKLA